MPAVTTTAPGATAELRAHHYAQVYRDTGRPQCQSDAKLTSSLGSAAIHHAVRCRAPDCSSCGLLSQLHPQRRGDGHHDTERQCLHLGARSGLDTVSATPSTASSAWHTYKPLHPPSARALFGGKPAAADARARRRGSITSCRPVPNLIDRCAS